MSSLTLDVGGGKMYWRSGEDEYGIRRAAGYYTSRSRAAYWDGRNAVGEPIASGLYFYTFTAGDFTATRKMLIRK